MREVWPAGASRCRCASRPTTGSATKESRRTKRSRSPRLRRRRRRHHRRLGRARPRRDARPVYGRMFQTPSPTRSATRPASPTMAVGNIYEPDHVNSILIAGPRRPRAPRPAAPGRPVVDAARRGAARLSRRDVAETLSRRPRSAAPLGRACASPGDRLTGTALSEASETKDRVLRSRRSPP